MGIDRNNIIGAHVRNLRVAAAMPMREIVDKLSMPISPQQFARYETGCSRWPADLICEVADILRVDVRVLLGIEEKQKAPSDDDIEADRYKAMLLKMGIKARRVMYYMIEGVSSL